MEINSKKIISGTNSCIKNCSISEEYKYELNGVCHSSCQYGIFFDEKDSIQKCKCEFDKCYSCPVNIKPAKNLCISCNESFYPKENDPTNFGPYINCYKDPPGYYLNTSDQNNYIYKPCYEKCLTCKISGDDINNNCLECNSNYSFGIPNNNYLNCYKNCSLNTTN